VAITFVWDAAFNAYPPQTLGKSLIDNNIRLPVRGIRERMEVEHEWGFNTEFDTGRHRAGYVTVMDKGNAAAMAAVSNPQEGALYLLTSGSDLQVHIRTGGAWVKLSSIDHAALAGLTDDDHPMYIRKNGGTMGGDLDMGGQLLDTAEGSAQKYSGFTLFRHRSSQHASLGATTVIANGILTATEVKISQTEVSGALNDGTWVTVAISYTAFFPQVYVSGSYDRDVWITPGVNAREIGIVNDSGSNRTYRLRYEWVAP